MRDASVSLAEPPAASTASGADVQLDLAVVLAALADPIRLRIVRLLADGRERACGEFELPIAKSTRSHHLRVLEESGIVRRRVEGKCRMTRLNRAELDARFPGLLDVVLGTCRI